MNSSFLKKLVPHAIAVGMFLLISLIYNAPALQGKVVNQEDVLGWKGMSQQSFDYYEKYGTYPLWSNSMFSGMPAFTIQYEEKSKFNIGYLHYVMTLGLPTPISYFFLACVSFYFLCMVLRVRYWIAIMAAIAYAYSTYDPIIIAVGHNTKMVAIGYMPAVIASFFLIVQRRYWLGGSLFALFVGLQIRWVHYQIVYYTFLIIGLIILFNLIHSIRLKQVKDFSIILGVALLSGLIGLGTFAVGILPFQDYAKETMRGGKSELTIGVVDEKNKTKGGLDKDYAFNWSYGISETLTLMVPGIYGGGTGGKEYKGETEFVKKMSEVGIPEENAIQMQNAYSYWGDQPGTSGPVYLGAVICFLFIFGMVYLRSWHKWWILAATVIGILLAWGKNFSEFNYLIFDYLPFYNKFRAPTQSLVIPQLTFPLLAALSLEQLFNNASNREYNWKKFKLSVYITGGIFALLFLFYISSDFKGKNDNQIRDGWAMQMSQGNTSPQAMQQAQSVSQSIIDALQDDRKSKYGSDLFRTFAYIVLAILLIGAYLKNKIKPMPVMIGLLLLSSIDLLAVGKRYLSADDFVEKDEFSAPLQPTAADLQIMADPDKPFRVFDQSDPNGWYQSSRASNFHNSIGGYSPAKLGLYQDLIEHQLAKGNMQVFNMLNTRYYIMENPATRQPVAQRNPDAFGPAWIVKGIKYVKNSDEEMKGLDSTNLRDTAVVQEKYKSAITFEPQFDSSASIRLIEDLNDRLKYEFNSSTNQFVVFSEVYYPRGWNAFIDGKKAEIVKTNYVLRGLAVPAGKHTIEFKFEPEAYNLGNTITLVSTSIIVLYLLFALYQEVRKRRKTT